MHFRALDQRMKVLTAEQTMDQREIQAREYVIAQIRRRTARTLVPAFGPR
jgi:hypothetical protein